MKRQSSLCLAGLTLSLFLIGCQGAQQNPASLAQPKTAMAARLDRAVRWLADDAREGRRSGMPGATASAEWLAAEMQAIGLEPAGGDGAWLQQFPVPLEPRTGGGSFVESIGPNPFLPRIDEEATRLVPMFCSSRGEVEGPLIFCGYGIQNEEKEWDDFEGLDLSDSIALILRGTPAAEAPSSRPTTTDDDTQMVSSEEAWGGSATLFMKVMNAKRRGAIGVLMLPNPRESEPTLLPFETGSGARAGIPCAMLSLPAPSLAGAENAISMEGLEALADKGASALVQASASFAHRVHLSCDVLREEGPAYNVLGLWSAARPGETVVVGAHYDHLGRGGAGSLAPGERGQVHNGADDNASGTAAALEIARALAQDPPESGQVLFALWSGEELGLLGSEHWAESPTVALENVRANLNLDMVGRAQSGQLQVLGAGTAAPFEAWLERHGQISGLELKVSRSGLGVGGSDHMTFLKREIPALHLFSGLHADYHRPSDDVENFEAKGAARVVRLSAGLVREMLAADELAYIEPEVDEQDPDRPRIESSFRAWFGSIPSYAYEGEGVLFDGVSVGSPAEKAGLLKGDILRQLGDIEIDTIYDFTYALQRYKAGDVVEARYLRDGEMQSVRMTLSSRGLR